MVQVSIIVPVHNEEENLPVLIGQLHTELQDKGFSYEILIVNDNSDDRTEGIARALSETVPEVRTINRRGERGFGRAIKDGFIHSKGEIFLPVMGDLSDDPKDAVKLINKALEGYDVVYGSRFVKGGKVEGYPPLKFLANRTFNNFVRFLYGIQEKDVTNAFKVYKRRVIESIGIQNIKSNDFDITVELPMKAHVLGFKSIEVPVTWHGRVRGASKLNLAKIGPIYIKRLLQVFWIGLVNGFRDIFKEVFKSSPTTVLASFLIGALLLLLIFTLAGAREVFELLRGASFGWMLLVGATYLMSFFFRAWRWNVMLLAIGYRVERGIVFRGIMFGWLLNALTPARLGDFGRAFALKICEDTSVSKTLSTVVVERVLDLVMLLIFIGFIFGFLMEDAALHQMAYAISMLIILLMTLLAFVVLFSRFFEAKTRKYLPRFSGVVMGFVDGTRMLAKNPMALSLSITLSFFVWIFEVFTVYFSAKSLDIELDIVVSWIGGIAAFVTQALPTTPGGIGAYELSMAGVLSIFGVMLNQGTAIAIVDHAIRTFIILFVGGLCTVHLGFRSRQYFGKRSSKYKGLKK